jgi:DNA-binding NarL/FixJ family response regulator
VVEGLTNPEIAERLSITERTVQAHVSAARAKLDARSRTQLAVFALRRGLVPFEPLEG